MSSAPSSAPSVPAQGFDEATQKELQEFVSQEQAKAAMNAKIMEFSDMCWERCVGNSNLGGRFSRDQSSCLTYCVDRFLDTSVFTVKRLQEQQKGHA